MEKLLPAGISKSPDAAKLGAILIVDDDVATARAIRTLLDRAGYETIVCHLGEDALAAASGKTFAAAVVDVHLPDFSGLVLTQKLREILGKTIPIIVASGDHSMETLNSLRHVGATYFFSKPIQPTSLVEHLQQYLG